MWADVKREYSDLGENFLSVKYGIWIPAFAGMTIGGASRHPTILHLPRGPRTKLHQGRIFIDSRGVEISAALQYWLLQKAQTIVQ